MFGDLFPARHLHRGPELEVGAAHFTIRGAQHDVSAEGVFLEHELERRLELVHGIVPSHEAAVGQLVGEKSLAHAADDAGAEHGADALDDRVQRQAALLSDIAQGMTVETFDLVLGHSEDLGIHLFGVLGGNSGGGSGHWWDITHTADAAGCNHANGTMGGGEGSTAKTRKVRRGTKVALNPVATGHVINPPTSLPTSLSYPPPYPPPPP